jgi:hypothetical protein
MLILSSEEFILDVIKRYRLVRVGGIKGNTALNELDKFLGTEVANVAGLNDGSFGMVVLRRYIPTLMDITSQNFPGSFVDLDYNPFQPTETDINYSGFFAEWFNQQMTGCASDEGEAFYIGMRSCMQRQL